MPSWTSSGASGRSTSSPTTCCSPDRWGPSCASMGFLPATRDNATTLLRSGSVTIVFPGGDHDVFRPSTEANRIDFAGRTGYVRTAVEAGVPIVPVVSIGGHETQLYLARGERLARLLRLDKLLRTTQAPLILGFPFGLTGAVPVNLPLPSKIVTQVLEPVAHRRGVRREARHRRGGRRGAPPDAGRPRRARRRAPLPGPRLKGRTTVLALLRRLRQALWVATVLLRSGMIAPLRPDKYLRMAAAGRRYGANPLVGFSLAAATGPARGRARRRARLAHLARAGPAHGCAHGRSADPR